MEFTKFKQMATDYADFIAEIETVSKEYCLLKEIDYNPMDNYYTHEAYADDATTFEIDEDDIIIHYIWDIGRCGETDWEHRSLRIPMEFFNPENRDNQELEIKRQKERLKDLNKELNTNESKLRTLKSEERDIKDDKWKMERLSSQYKQEFDERPFIDKIDNIQDQINKQQKIIENLRQKISKLQN